MVHPAALGAFFATPPDTSRLPIMSNSLRHGLSRSLWTVAGGLSANVLQMTAAGFALAAIITASAGVLVWIKWLGAACLLWIGIALWRAAPRDDLPGAARRTGAAALFRQGFLTSGANPYAVVFFGALFPQFIDPAAPILPQVAVLGATYLVVDGAVLLLWAAIARQTLCRIRVLSAVWVNRLAGALMIGAAALLGSRNLEGATR